MPVLGLLLLLAMAASLAMGAVEIAPAEVAGVLLGRLGLGLAEVPSERAIAVVWGLRVPRILLGLLVGGTLGATGVALQGMLRNEMADPHLLGIGPGAAIGAALGASVGGVQGGIAGGVATGVLTALVVRRLGRSARLDRSKLILGGVALGATLSAWTGFVVFGSDRSVVPPLEFWLLGSLSGATWRSLGTTLFFLAIGVGGLLIAARTLDLIALGEQQAWEVGVDVDMASTVVLMLIGTAVGATVGAVGVVVFVGLLIPRLIRPLVGPLHRHLILAAMVGGGGFLVGSDLVARLLLEPVEIPVGLVTSVFGGPMFLWLATRHHRG